MILSPPPSPRSISISSEWIEKEEHEKEKYHLLNEINLLKINSLKESEKLKKENEKLNEKLENLFFDLSKLERNFSQIEQEKFFYKSQFDDLSFRVNNLELLTPSRHHSHLTNFSQKDVLKIFYIFYFHFFFFLFLFYFYLLFIFILFLFYFFFFFFFFKIFC